MPAPRHAPALHPTFATAAAAVMLASLFLGFARSFFLRAQFPEFEPHVPKEPVFFWHGVVVTGWFLLLLVQPALLQFQARAWHRRAGWLGLGLAAAVVGLSVHISLVAARRPGGFLDVPIPPAQFLLIPLAELLTFGVGLGLAFIKRRQRDWHARCLLWASLGLLGSAVVRWPFDWVVAPVPVLSPSDWVVDAMALAMCAHDRWRLGRVHPASALGVAVLLAVQLLSNHLADSAAWLALAEWLI